jgi:serine/threonine protein kinase
LEGVPPSDHPDEQSHLVPGYRLDRYELLCPIGRGGMASVWVARLLGKHGFEKLVAIKTILTRFARDPHFQQMFLDEARIASGIHHPNVAQILDLGDQQGVLFLVMEWIEGDALSKLARATRERGLVFPPGVALRVAADVCAGLHAAHELRDRNGGWLGIVHRDVSPQNILIGDQGVAKIIDFGIAKARGRSSNDTETGSVKGKVKYMAPEQAIAPQSTDRRADVWALGAILYFLASGRSPYEGENDVATLTKLASGRPPLALPAHVGKPFRAITTRALACKPDDRYATAEEFRRAIEAAMLEGGIATTSAEVAAYCTQQLAGRAEARKSAITLALSAAEERSRVFGLLTQAEDSSKSLPFDALSSSASSAAGTPSRAPGQPVVSTPLAENSLTLGAAATMTKNPVASPARKRWGVVAVLMSFAVIPLVIVVSLGRRGGNASNGAPGFSAPHEPPPVISAAAPTAPSSSIAAETTTGPPVGSATAAAPSTPPPSRRRAPAGRPAGPSHDSPATAGTIQQRADYGF